jgi:hypothetical protein
MPQVASDKFHGCYSASIYPRKQFKPLTASVFRDLLRQLRWTPGKTLQNLQLSTRPGLSQIPPSTISPSIISIDSRKSVLELPLQGIIRPGPPGPTWSRVGAGLGL